MRGDLPVESLLDGVPGNVVRAGIGREGFGIVAVEVARHLVQQQDQGEAAPGRLPPGVIGARRGALIVVRQGFAHGPVQGLVPLEPTVAVARAEPEVQHPPYGILIGIAIRFSHSRHVPPFAEEPSV